MAQTNAHFAVGPDAFAVRAAMGDRPEHPLHQGAGQFLAMLCIGLPFSFGFQVLRNFATALNKPNAARPGHR